MSETEQVQPKVFRFENENDALEGRLISVRASKYSNAYGILTEQGEVTVFGTKVLDSRIRPEYLGRQVRIVYRGLIQGKNHSYKSFDVSLNGEKTGE